MPDVVNPCVEFGLTLNSQHERAQDQPFAGASGASRVCVAETCIACFVDIGDEVRIGRFEGQNHGEETQVQKFREAARALGAEDEDRFNKILGKVAKAKPIDPDELAKVTEGIARRVGNLPPDPKKPRR